LRLEFTLNFSTNFVDPLDIRDSREVFPIQVRSPEFTALDDAMDLWNINSKMR